MSTKPPALGLPSLPSPEAGEGGFVKLTATLEPLFEFWAGVAETPDHPLQSNAQAIVRALAEHPELRGPLTGELKAAHSRTITHALSAVLPEGLQRFSFSAAVVPGSFDVEFATPRFRRELLDADGKMRGRLFATALDWERASKIFICLAIARRFYQLDIDFQTSVILEVDEATSGLKRYFQMRAHMEHVRLRAPEQLASLTPVQVQELRRNLADMDNWRRHIPLHLFEMYGLTIIDATEVTEEIVLTSIQQELVAKDCLRDRGRLLSLQQHLRELLRIPDLLVAVPVYHDQQVLVFSPSSNGEKADWLEDACAFAPQVCPVEYSRSSATCVIDDLTAEPSLTPCAQDIKGMGMRSYLTMPLSLEGRTLGSLVCCSPRPAVFSPLTPDRLHQVLPQLAWAAQRTMDGMESKIRSVMRERFTAIHPAVEWRFRQDAVAVVKGESTPGDIVFPNLYPLFGTSDVRDSTLLRNRAIVADLATQLDLADTVLATAGETRPLAYLDSLRFRIASWKQQLCQGLNTGDESRSLEFLKQELETLFDSLIPMGRAVEEAVMRYHASLDPRLGLVYQERKLYEDSMNLVREKVGEVLTRSQERAQRDFPHYFEMHKTDGVDHTMYIGASMVEDGRFDLLYLRNLRLWQLQTMVEVVRETRDLARQMTLKMETAHLILVQDSPLSIRFSLEDKQFNVDGTYNARYEILKKRIDKAEVREKGERLTQPGKLAMVYSHPRESAEYQRYLRYLVSQGLIHEQIEDLELAALQGVSGLRALRVQVL